MNNPDQQCICRKSLNKYNSSAAPHGTVCRNCLKELSSNSSEPIFACAASGCFYIHIANQNYIICQNCYNVENTTTFASDDMDKTEFTCNKIKSSIDTISYVFYFIFILFITTWSLSFIIPLNRESYHGYS